VAAERPQLGPEVMSIAEAYVDLRYAERTPQDTGELRRRVRRLKPVKPGSE